MKGRLQHGQTLVTLLIFMIIGITITTAAVVMVIVNSRNVSRIEQGNDTLSIAESGVENALIRLLRDPAYTGETLLVGTGSTVVQITTSGNEKTITSTAVQGNFSRKLQVVLTVNGELTITSWQEIF